MRGPAPQLAPCQPKPGGQAKGTRGAALQFHLLSPGWMEFTPRQTMASLEKFPRHPVPPALLRLLDELGPVQESRSEYWPPQGTCPQPFYFPVTLGRSLPLQNSAFVRKQRLSLPIFHSEESRSRDGRWGNRTHHTEEWMPRVCNHPALGPLSAAWWPASVIQAGQARPCVPVCLGQGALGRATVRL